MIQRPARIVSTNSPVATTVDRACDESFRVTATAIALLSTPLWFPLVYMMLAAVEFHYLKTGLLSALSIPVGIIALIAASAPLLAVNSFPILVRCFLWLIYVAFSIVVGVVFGMSGFYTAQGWFR